MSLHTPPPNIILIHCHDLGTWLSCYGHPSVPSPNLHELADQGIVFDAAFATSPLCTPARSSLFTGLSPQANGLMGLTHEGWRYRAGVQTLPELLADEGYRTALLGLQHEDLDARVLGYEEVHGLGFLPRALEVAQMTEKWLGAAAEDGDDRPYFATVGMWEAHRPWPQEDYAPVPVDEVEVPPYLPDNPHTRKDLSHFYGAIQQMDTAVGRILRVIESTPTSGNTMVIFTTDHGAAFPRAKSTLYDPGVQVALIMKPPATWNYEPGRRHNLVSHLDLVPTLLEIIGAEPREELEGKSLVPALHQSLEDPDRELVLEKTYHDGYDPIRAIRTRDAKYIQNFVEAAQLPLPMDLEQSETRRGLGDDHLKSRPMEELYLLRSDPWELNNLAGDVDHSNLQQHLMRRLSERLRASNDPILDGEIPAPPVPQRGTRRSQNGPAPGQGLRNSKPHTSRQLNPAEHYPEKPLLETGSKTQGAEHRGNALRPPGSSSGKTAR